MLLQGARRGGTDLGHAALLLTGPPSVARPVLAPREGALPAGPPGPEALPLIVAGRKGGVLPGLLDAAVPGLLDAAVPGLLDAAVPGLLEAPSACARLPGGAAAGAGHPGLQSVG